MLAAVLLPLAGVTVPAAKGKAIRKAKGTPRATTTITKESKKKKQKKKKKGEQAVHNMVSSWFA